MVVGIKHGLCTAMQLDSSIHRQMKVRTEGCEEIFYFGLGRALRA